MKGRLGLGLVLGVLVLGTVWLFRPAAIPAQLAEVARGPLRVTVDEEGETRVRQRFVVAAPTAGRLRRIELDEGDPVSVGTVLARIEPAPLGPRELASARARLEVAEAAQQGATASMERARAALAQARRARQRADKLREAGTLSTEAHENARLGQTSAAREFEAAEFAVDAANHEVEATRAVLLAAAGPGARDGGPVDPACDGPTPCVVVRAPVEGRVLRVLEESERIVGAGTPLLQLGDPGSLEIVVDILSTDAVRVRPGAAVRIEDWGGETALPARVRRLEPSAFTKVSALGVEEQRVNVIADLEQAVAELGDGYRVEARIVIWEAEDVLQVPASALFRSGEGWQVFVVEAGRAALRDVVVGHLGGFEAEIREGLDAGEIVILHPSDQVQDGARIEAL